MIWVVLASIVLLFFYLLKNSDHTKTKIEIEITTPHPEKCQDETMLRFIDNTSKEKLIAVLREFNNQGYILKPLYTKAFLQKIETGKIDYFTLSEENNIDLNEIEPIGDKLKRERQEKRETFTENYHFEIAGVHIPNRKNKIRRHCNEDDELFLFAEPKNKFDSDAIKVECILGLIGYVPADDNIFLKDIIKKDYYCYISEIDLDDNYLIVNATIEY